MIKPNQIIAARGLLGWTQVNLVESVLEMGMKLTRPALQAIESGRVDQPRLQTMEAIIKTFNDAGIVFNDRGGVEFREATTKVIQGDDCFLRFQDDIFYELRDERGEALYMFIDEGFNEPEESDPIVAKDLMMRRAGIRMRMLIREGDKSLMFPLHEYRTIPSQFFHNNIQVAYGNKFAIVENDDRIVVFDNPHLAQSQRKVFDYMWSMGKQPTETIRQKTYE